MRVNEKDLEEIVDSLPFVKKTGLKEKTMRYLEQDLKKLSVEQNWKGSGTEIDPFIVSSPHPFPEDYNILIKDSNLYIKFNQCTFYSFKIKNCENISFNGCQFNDLSILRSTDTFLTDVNVQYLYLKSSFHINIKKSSIISLNLTNSFMNSIKGGSIQKISKMRSPDNLIDVKNISEEYKRRGNRFPANILALIVMSIMLLLILSYIYFAFLLESKFNFALIFCFIMIAMLSLGMIIAIVEIKRLNKSVRICYSEKRIVYPNLKKQILGGSFIILGIIIINVFYTLSIFYIDNWDNNNLRTLISISSVIVCSFIISLGANFLIISRPFDKGIIKEGINPLYPIFIPSATFFIPFNLLIMFGYFLEVFITMSFMDLLFIIAFVLFLGISLVTLYRFKKMLKSGKKLSISQERFRQVYGSTLVIFSIPLFFSYINVVKEDVPVSYILGIFIAIFLFGIFLIFLLGFGSINKIISPTDSFSAVRSLQNGEYDNALRLFKKLLETDPENVIMLNNIGVVYVNLEQYENALDTFKHVLELDPDSKPAWNGLGAVYCHLEEYEKAIEMLEKGLTLPKKPLFNSNWADNLAHSFLPFSVDDRIIYNLANTYQKKGDFEKAIETCEKGFKLNSKFEDLWEIYITIYLEKGELDKCIEICKQCLELNPLFEQIYNLLAMVYRHKGNLNKALEVLNKAKEINYKNYQTSFNLAVVYLDLKEYRNAITACNISLRFKPNNPTVLKFREKIYKELSQN
ncbi:MAG: tetratricopeptide repeat protein [Promethearchaeota archaeon]